MDKETEIIGKAGTEKVSWDKTGQLELTCMLPRDALVGKKFAFSRMDGRSICASITLAEGGKIGGYYNPNEAGWRISDGVLQFLDMHGHPTTVFDRLELQDDAYVLHGRFRDETHQHWHVLTEKRVKPARLSGNLEQIAQLFSTLGGGKSRKALCVFLIHNISTWDALYGIYEEMRGSNDFLPIVVTIPFNFGEGVFHGEDDLHAAFDAIGIPHVRFNFADHWEGLALLKALRPEFMFRQAPWDGDIPSAYAVEELSFTRLIYTDYGIGILKDKDDNVSVDYAQELHRKAWMLLCANEDQKKIYEIYGRHHSVRAVVTGYPKFDRLVERGREEQSWPIVGFGRGFRLVWAPHHSLTPEWLGFGTFHRVYKEILEWVSANPDIEIVLKPHPMLFESRGHGLLSAAEIEAFLAAWNALPNTAYQTGGDYAPLLGASDAMVTEGVSFLAEYQLFGKPLIWLDSKQHVGFNLIGEEIMKGAYGVQSAAELIDLVARLRDGKSDPLQSKRDEIARYLMPFPGAGAARTVATIRQKMNA